MSLHTPLLAKADDDKRSANMNLPNAQRDDMSQGYNMYGRTGGAQDMSMNMRKKTTELSVLSNERDNQKLFQNS